MTYFRSFLNLSVWILTLGWLPAQLRIDEASFDVPEAEVRAIVQSVIAAFPEESLPPLVVTNHPAGPATLYQKNLRGETVIRVSVQGRYWAQLIYQFAHELMHVRHRFRETPADQRWREEMLCEVASLFVLRRLSRTWKAHPPLSHLKDYRQHLWEYAERVMASREPLAASDVTTFLEKHRLSLSSNPKDRARNGSLALALLPWFEGDPRRWSRVREFRLSMISSP